MKIKLHLKIFIFIAIFILTRQIEIYGVLMLFALFHEIGHMITGIILGFRPNSLEILPFGLAVGFESKVEDLNCKIINGNILTLKKIIIAAGGPMINLLFVLIFLFFDIPFLGINRDIILYSNILIALFNLISIYPLDGGRIIKGILHIFFGRRKSYDYINKISNITIIILTAICSIGILYIRNISIILILTYLWYLIIKENKKYKNLQLIFNRVN